MKATCLLLASAVLLTSCSKFPGSDPDPVAPPLSAAEEFGVPPTEAPYQPIEAIEPINPPTSVAVPTAPVALPPNAPTPADPAPVASPELNGNVYNIQTGDSLWGISRKFNTTVEAIKELNGLSSDTIVAGRTLIIPGR